MDDLRITMSAKDAANFLGISYWLLLEQVKQRKIPCVQVGNRKLFRKTSLEKWLSIQEDSSVKKTNSEV